MQERIDFTNCKRIAGKAYNGANGKKIAVEYNGVEYMIKFLPSGENKPTELSYTNSCVSEYIASHIFHMLGIQAHETLLGTFTVSGKEKIVCACRDFTSIGAWYEKILLPVFEQTQDIRQEETPTLSM